MNIKTIEELNSLLPQDFDWQYYIDIHPDLQIANIKSEIQAKYHYVIFGKKEERIYKQNEIDTQKNNIINEINEDAQIALFVQWYLDGKTEENRIKCLHENIKNSHINHIHIFSDTKDISYISSLVESNQKISISYINKRLSYKEWIKYADRNYKDYIKILINSDIYLDNTITEIKYNSFNNRIVYGITRKDLNKNGNIENSKDWYADDATPANPLYSHDCWIYKDDLQLSDEAMNQLDINLGYDNCDRLFKKIITKQSIKFINLYPEVNAIHIDYRNKSKKNRASYSLSNYSPEKDITNEEKKLKILVKIPTFNRPEQLLKSIKSFINKQSKKYTLEIIVSANTEDKKTQNIKQKIVKYKNTKVYFSEINSKIDAYNADLSDKNFDILILASDDMIPVVENYDEIIVENMLNFFPDLDGTLWFDNGDGNLRTNTLCIIGYPLFKKIMPIYNPLYKGYYCDDEFSQIVMKLGKVVRIDQNIIKHCIPENVVMFNESTYLKSLVYGMTDRAKFKIRKKIQFDIPGIEPLPKHHNIPKKFLEHKRNQLWSNSWHISESRYDDAISVMDLYALEDMDKKILSMNTNEFLEFSKNYFRNFRWTIPNTIHQIWLGKMPKEIKEMTKTFEDYTKSFPNFRYILWDENKLKNLNMFNKDIFDKENSYDCKADIARLEILNKFGGIYIDADMIWLGNKSIQSIFNMASYGILLAYEKSGSYIGRGYLKPETTRCANGVFGSTIQNPIIAYLIGQLRKSYEKNRCHGVVSATGPDFIQSTIDSLKPNMNISFLDSKYFYPCWWSLNKTYNTSYDEFIQSSSMTNIELINKYPEAILFNRSWNKNQK